MVAVAAALKTALRRPFDMLARYGGEEFAALLPGADAEGAIEIAESLRRQVAAIDFQEEGAAIALSCSIGICTASPSRDLAAELAVKRADQALYHSKHGGRNRVIAFSS